MLSKWKVCSGLLHPLSLEVSEFPLDPIEAIEGVDYSTPSYQHTRIIPQSEIQLGIIITLHFVEKLDSKEKAASLEGG